MTLIQHLELIYWLFSISVRRLVIIKNYRCESFTDVAMPTLTNTMRKPHKVLKFMNYVGKTLEEVIEMIPTVTGTVISVFVQVVQLNF